MDLSVYRYMPRLAAKKEKGRVGGFHRASRIPHTLAVNTEKVAWCDVFGLSVSDNSAISLK
jgi:hypothetical protein